jgi:hypothetical protein
MKEEVRKEYERGEYVQMGNLRVANSFLEYLADIDGVTVDELVADVMDYPKPPKDNESNSSNGPE